MSLEKQVSLAEHRESALMEEPSVFRLVVVHGLGPDFEVTSESTAAGPFVRDEDGVPAGGRQYPSEQSLCIQHQGIPILASLHKSSNAMSRLSVLRDSCSVISSAHMPARIAEDCHEEREVAPKGRP